MSVDPLAADYVAWSPYNYVLGNPLKFVDLDGRSAKDIIDVNKKTGQISITKTLGDDVVRLINDGKVESSYTYGTNGSFSKDFKLIDHKESTYLVSENQRKANQFYEFAAKSDVEFGIVDVKEGASFMVTSHDPEKLPGLVRLTKTLSEMGYTGQRQSHSHPGTITNYNESVPSGYFDIVQGNPSSLMPYLKNGKKEGDALNAIQVRDLKGFKNTKFEVFAPGNKTKTIYDGVNRANIIEY